MSIVDFIPSKMCKESQAYVMSSENVRNDITSEKRFGKMKKI